MYDYDNVIDIWVEGTAGTPLTPDQAAEFVRELQSLRRYAVDDGICGYRYRIDDQLEWTDEFESWLGGQVGCYYGTNEESLVYWIMDVYKNFGFVNVHFEMNR